MVTLPAAQDKSEARGGAFIEEDPTPRSGELLDGISVRLGGGDRDSTSGVTSRGAGPLG